VPQGLHESRIDRLDWARSKFLHSLDSAFQYPGRHAVALRWSRTANGHGLSFEDFDLREMAMDIQKHFGVDLDDSTFVITSKEPTVFDFAVSIGTLAGMTAEEVLSDLISIIANRLSRYPKTITAASTLS